VGTINVLDFLCSLNVRCIWESESFQNITIYAWRSAVRAQTYSVWARNHDCRKKIEFVPVLAVLVRNRFGSGIHPQ